MALCPNCPAIDEFGLHGIEFYDCGKGCPDKDMDVYGGDCYANTRECQQELEELYPEDYLDYFPYWKM